MHFKLRQNFKSLPRERFPEERLGLLAKFGMQETITSMVSYFILGGEFLPSHCVSTDITLVDVCYAVEDKKSQQDNKSKKLYLLKNIHFKVGAGQLTAIIGPSGAGKSTIIKLLSGNLRPSSGSIFINKVRPSFHYKRVYFNLLIGKGTHLWQPSITDWIRSSR